MHGYYEEVGCGCITAKLAMGDSGSGKGSNTDANGLTPSMAKVVKSLLPRYVPNNIIGELSSLVQDAARESEKPELAEMAEIWVERSKNNKAAVCEEIYSASLGVARGQLAHHIAEWKEKALNYWAWIVRLKALIPVVVTAFLDGCLVLHKVIDPATLVFRGDGIPVSMVKLTMYIPICTAFFLLMYAFFARIAGNVLRKEEKRNKEVRDDLKMLSQMSAEKKEQVLRERKEKTRKILEKKYKGKKKVDEEMIKKYEQRTPMCTSGMWRNTGKGCLWSAIFLVVVATGFGFYIKALTAFRAFTGKFGAGIQILLNITDIAYVLLAFLLIIPKLARKSI